MYRQKTHGVWTSEIAEYLNRNLQGEDFLVDDPTSIVTPRSAAHAPRLPREGRKTLVLAPASPAGPSPTTFIPSDQPEVDLARLLLEFFATAPVNRIHPTALISEDARIGRNVMVGAYSMIGSGVEVGDNTRILNRVVISGPAVLGKYCVVKDGAVIGSEGYGFVISEDGTPLHPPHLGRIVIGDRVWVGSNSTVERGMLVETIIEDDVKVDDLVHVGSGARIGSRCMLTAGVVIAFDVTLGPDVTVAPNAAIRESLTVAPGVVVGQGAVVIRDLTERGAYVGNPARLLRRT
ncbi:MAG: hypothetical protein HZB55_19720 [Deltaproteobacteria bacterium]|nr:hypothetical protein [Deltaproteobacteria bacterium]